MRCVLSDESEISEFSIRHFSHFPLILWFLDSRTDEGLCIFFYSDDALIDISLSWVHFSHSAHSRDISRISMILCSCIDEEEVSCLDFPIVASIVEYTCTRSRCDDRWICLYHMVRSKYPSNLGFDLIFVHSWFYNCPYMVMCQLRHSDGFSDFLDLFSRLDHPKWSHESIEIGALFSRDAPSEIRIYMVSVRNEGFAITSPCSHGSDIGDTRETSNLAMILARTPPDLLDLADRIRVDRPVSMSVALGSDEEHIG